uniref:Uncharacterized protein n=1 Tax=Noctiluca scintillans TaxID=2966 RepID=A0A7S1EYE5_NOCSC
MAKPPDSPIAEPPAMVAEVPTWPTVGGVTPPPLSGERGLVSNSQRTRWSSLTPQRGKRVSRRDSRSLEPHRYAVGSPTGVSWTLPTFDPSKSSQQESGTLSDVIGIFQRASWCCHHRRKPGAEEFLARKDDSALDP